jgi:hypothetical protein
LPTTEAGTCGTILIANAAVGKGVAVGRWVMWCIGLVLMGLGLIGIGVV